MPITASQIASTWTSKSPAQLKSILDTGTRFGTGTKFVPATRTVDRLFGSSQRSHKCRSIEHHDDRGMGRKRESIADVPRSADPECLVQLPKRSEADRHRGRARIPQLLLPRTLFKLSSSLCTTAELFSLAAVAAAHQG
jgi:hypothetical protein